MQSTDRGEPFWRSIAEPEPEVLVLRGILATRPAAYQRYEARHPSPGFADRCAELLHRFSALAFSGLLHLLVLILLTELVYIAIPVLQETILTAQLQRPSAVADAPSPDPGALESKPEQAFDRVAEAPRVDEQPKPAQVPPSMVVGAGTNEVPGRPVAAGVLENVQELRETGLAHFTGAGIFHNRSESGRREAVGRYGGNAASEAAVERGLRWLAAHQLEDGRWSSARLAERCPPDEPCSTLPKFVTVGPWGEFPVTQGYDHGLTGLSLLAFLGAGYTAREGPYRENVDRAILWLLSRQDARGFFFDSFRETAPGVPGSWPGGMYGHGIATFALGEACAITRDERLFRALEKAVAATARSQVPNGGWAYFAGGNAAGGRWAVTSEFTLSVWQMMGLKAAEKAGIEVPEGTIARAMAYVRSSTHPSGGVHYYPESGITLGSTGAALFARCMFGMTEGGLIEKGLATMDRSPTAEPVLGQSGFFEHLYCWYYRTLVAFQLQGRPWREWNGKLRPFLVSAQKAGGHAAGSWSIVDYRHAGTVYGTALCILMLETYYRYLPMIGDRSALREAVAATEEESDAPVPDAELAEVRRRIRSPRSEDRYLAAAKLAELGDKRSLPEMIAAAEKESGRLRAILVSSVGRLKCEEAIPWLVGLLDDPDTLVRTAAMSALATTTGADRADAAGWKSWYADRLRRERAPGR